MKSVTYIRITAAIFGVVAIAHAVRLILRVPIHAGSLEVPMWISYVGIVAPGALSIWGFASLGRS